MIPSPYKRIIYLTLFTLLGVLVSFLIHAAIEIPLIYLLIKDIGRYGLGLTLDQWFVVHEIATPILFMLGALVGYLQGRLFWRIIYIEGRRRS